MEDHEQLGATPLRTLSFLGCPLPKFHAQVSLLPSGLSTPPTLRLFLSFVPCPLSCPQAHTRMWEINAKGFAFHARLTRPHGGPVKLVSCPRLSWGQICRSQPQEVYQVSQQLRGLILQLISKALAHIL